MTSRRDLLARWEEWRADKEMQAERDEAAQAVDVRADHRLEDRYLQLADEAFVILAREQEVGLDEADLTGTCPWHPGDPDPTQDRTPGRPTCGAVRGGWTCTWHPDRHDPGWHIAGHGEHNRVISVWPVDSTNP
jgi:hypothetical protein